MRYYQKINPVMVIITHYFLISIVIWRKLIIAIIAAMLVFMLIKMAKPWSNEKKKPEKKQNYSQKRF